jgi:hypothetical protein
MKSTEQVHLELLAALSELSKLRPQWRLGQTVANLATTAGRLDAGGVWDLEDDEALSAARTLIAQYSEIDSKLTGSGAAPDQGHPTDAVPQDGIAGSPGTKKRRRKK